MSNTPDNHQHTNPFQLLALPQTFNLASAQIEQAFLAKIASAHPDSAKQSDNHSPDQGSQASESLQAARQILKDPEQRARLLLALLAPTQPDSSALPDGFLMEIMEVREQVEHDRGNPDRLEHWEDWADQQRQQHIKAVAELFSSAPDPMDQPAADAIKLQLNAWRYIERMIEQLDPNYSPNTADF